MGGSIKSSVRAMAAPLGAVLARAGVSANGVTLAGLVLAGITGAMLAGGRWGLGLLFFLASSLCDLLDGAVARARGASGSPLGAALDSTADRYGEALVLGGVLIDAHLRSGAGEIYTWIWVLALTGSFLTSYVRARAEGLGLRCEVGLMERPARLALIGILCLIGPRAGIWTLTLLALGGHITFVQRLLHVRRESMRPARDREGH